MPEASTPAPGDRAGSGVTPWSEADQARALELVAMTLTELLGFQVASISLVDGDDLVIAATAGTTVFTLRDGQEVDIAGMVGWRYPVEGTLAELEGSEDWGRFRFVPHDRVANLLSVDRLANVADDDPLAWHPLDVLAAPVHDASGRLVALLAIGAPVDGLRPDPTTHRLMDKYAEQAVRTVLDNLERRRLGERARLLAGAREVVRSAAKEQSIQGVVSEAGESLLAAFDAVMLWVIVFDDHGHPVVEHFGREDEAMAEADLPGVARRGAERLWPLRTCSYICHDDARTYLISEEEVDRTREFLRDRGYGGVLFAPIGAGPEVLGALLVVRGQEHASWSTLEQEAALDVSRDLGRLLVYVRTFEREQQLVRELRGLEAYKSQLVDEVSRRIDAPLRTIVGNVAELTRDPARVDPGAVRRILRSGQELQGMLDDLLTLARVADPEHQPERTRVDLAAVARKVVAYAAATAGGRDLVVRARVPEEPVEVLGIADDLERVVFDLTSNAVKFTPDDGLVTVRVTGGDGTPVELTVSDTGIGIAEDDREHLLQDFFRSADPRVQAQPGTGLGLAVAGRIIARHDGRISFESPPGGGTRVRVTLPPA